MECEHEPGCPYHRSTFSVTCNPQPPEYFVTHEAVWLDSICNTWIYPLDLPDELNKIEIWNRQGPPVGWEGRTGRGVVFLDWIRRSRRSTAPHMSEFTKAAYEMYFPLSSLRYIFVTESLKLTRCDVFGMRCMVLKDSRILQTNRWSGVPRASFMPCWVLQWVGSLRLLFCLRGDKVESELQGSLLFTMVSISNA